MKKKTAKALVAEFLGDLKNMSHSELFCFAGQHGFDSRAGFFCFRKALLSRGIDYINLRVTAA